MRHGPGGSVIRGPGSGRFDSIDAPPSVPGVDGLVSALLSAASARFKSVQPKSARAFLRLVRRAESKPGRTWEDFGRLLFEDREYAAAGRAFGYAAAYRPTDAGLQATLALTCLRLDDLASFQGYIQRAIAIDPTNPVALEMLADLNRQYGDPLVGAGLYAALLKGRRGSRAHQVALGQCLAQASSRATLLHFIGRRHS